MARGDLQAGSGDGPACASVCDIANGQYREHVMNPGCPAIAVGAP
jgi:hypothetical protein